MEEASHVPIQLAIHAGDACLEKSDLYHKRVGTMQTSAGQNYLKAEELCKEQELPFPEMLERYSTQSVDIVRMCIKRLTHERTDQIREAVRTAQPGETQREIAERFGVTRQAVTKAAAIAAVVTLGNQLPNVTDLPERVVALLVPSSTRLAITALKALPADQRAYVREWIAQNWST